MTAVWKIARGGKRCGYDWEVIPEGQPYQEVTHSGKARTFVRCLAHVLVPADEAAIEKAVAADEAVQEKNAIDEADKAARDQAPTPIYAPRARRSGRSLEPLSAIAASDRWLPTGDRN